MKYNKSLRTYIDIYEIIDSKVESREDNRLFGLAHKELLDSPYRALVSWSDSLLHLLPYPRLSQKIVGTLHTISTISMVISFILGILSGMGLLYYNGSEPINVLYFLAIVLLFPTISLLFSIVAMFSRGQSLLIDISPTHIIEKFISKFYKESITIKHNPRISNALIIQRSLLLGILFYTAIVLVLLGNILTRDIAFSWSTTLHITPQELYSLLYTIASPWREFVPDALPSLELIQKSQYFRLGGRLGSDLIDNASLLGEWWKFLAMSTIFYAIALRVPFWIFASIRLDRVIRDATLILARDILSQMREPIITTQALSSETPLPQSVEPIVKIVVPKESYPYTIGWAIDEDTIREYNTKDGIDGSRLYKVGGDNSIREDEDILKSIDGDTLLYVKSWEPPTMDFIDFIEELSIRCHIIIYPMGSVDYEYRAKDEEFRIWERKVSLLRSENIRMRR